MSVNSEEGRDGDYLVFCFGFGLFTAFSSTNPTTLYPVSIIV